MKVTVQTIANDIPLPPVLDSGEFISRRQTKAQYRTLLSNRPLKVTGKPVTPAPVTFSV